MADRQALFRCSHARDAAVEVSQIVAGSDDPSAQGADVQDLVILLLDAAVRAGDAVDRLDRFTAVCPAADRRSAADLADALRLMNDARSALIRCADDLSAGPAR